MDLTKALLPLAPKDRDWDGDAARDNLAEWAGGPDKEEIDWGKYARGFAWVESADEDGHKYEDFHLPFADIVSSEDDQDGEPHAVYKGCAAVVGALNGARGADVPEGPRQDAYDLMAAYYEAFEEEIPELKSLDEDGDGTADDEVEASAPAEGARLPFRATLPITRYYMEKAGDEEERHYVEGAASDVSRDVHGDRMADSTIVKFVEYVELADPPVGWDVEHSEAWTDQIGMSVEAAVLYEPPEGFDGEPPIFWVKAEIDVGMSHGRDLVTALKRGKRLGLSIAGDIIAWHMEKDGTRVLDHVRLYKVAVTKQPANRNTWLAHMTKSVAWDGEPEAEGARRPVAAGEEAEGMSDRVKKQEEDEGTETVPQWLDFDWVSSVNDFYSLMDSLFEVARNIFWEAELEPARRVELFGQAVEAFRSRMSELMSKEASEKEAMAGALLKTVQALGVRAAEGDWNTEGAEGLPAALPSLVKAVEEWEPEGEEPEGEPEDAPEGEPEDEDSEPEDPGAPEGDGAGGEPEGEGSPESGDPAAAEGAGQGEVVKALGVMQDQVQQALKDMQQGLETVQASLAQELEQVTGRVEALATDVSALKKTPVGRKGLNANALPAGVDLDDQIQKALERGDKETARRLTWKKWKGQ